MKNLLLLEWRKVKVPVLTVLFFCTVLSIYLCSSIYKSYALEEQLEAWEVGTTIFNLLFPLIAVIPTGWLLYYEKKNGFLNYTLPRTSKKQYLLAKWIVMSGSAFTLVFTIFFVSALVVLFVNNPIDVHYGLIDPITVNIVPSTEANHLAGSLFVNQPLVYAALLSFWKGILAALLATMGFIFSLYIQNLFIILTGPFVYLMLDNYILAMLRLEAYRFIVSFEPTSVTTSAITVFSFLTGPLLALLLMTLFILYMRYVKKTTDWV
ncbi:hypothetical protein AUC31_01885 [Planococcus rifietoensis]|uniref:Uncharacterized protein n=1 Tax=Planococcus rifietoensis TaxID=200991 RepID=A0A0U2YR44_9BACL|nr:hypothetical protein [Planococcus rifietoensis]ALS74078.1 hypothetical protein AUC31_01885 [Planococcus rifietoensis]